MHLLFQIHIISINQNSKDGTSLNLPLHIKENAFANTQSSSVHLNSTYCRWKNTHVFVQDGKIKSLAILMASLAKEKCINTQTNFLS